MSTRSATTFPVEQGPRFRSELDLPACTANQAIALLDIKEARGTYVRFSGFHAIAHVLEWPDRERLWAEAGLPFIENPGVCNFEPGGARR